YKMGERQSYVEASFWRDQLESYWKEPLTLGVKRHLIYFTNQAEQSDQDDEGVPRPQADEDRVKAARAKLKDYALEKLVYNQIIREIGKQGEPYGLGDATKGQVGFELIENPNSQSVPYAFTKHAFYDRVQGSAWLSVYKQLSQKNENDYVLSKS